MGDWARKTAERLIAVEKERTEQTARAQEEKRLLSFRAPRVWQQLRNWLKMNCEDLNHRSGKKVLEFEIWPQSGAKVRRIDQPAVLQVEFAEEARRVKYSCGAGRGEYQFGVNTDGTVLLQDAYHREYSPEEVGEKLLDLVLSSPF